VLSLGGSVSVATWSSTVRAAGMVADGSDVGFVFGVLIVSASDALAGWLLT